MRWISFRAATLPRFNPGGGEHRRRYGQGAAIAALQSGLAANDATDLVQGGAIASLQAGLAANGLVDTVQTGAIAALDVRIATNEPIDLQQGTDISALRRARRKWRIDAVKPAPSPRWMGA